MLPVKADSQMPFTSVRDLGRVEVILGDLAKFCTKTVSVVSQKVTPLEMLKSWNEGTSPQILPAVISPFANEEVPGSCWTPSNIQTIEHQGI